MKILECVNSDSIPFQWINIDNYRKSEAFRCEIYITNIDNKTNEEIIENLIVLFYDLFGELKDDILIYNNNWWDFCLDTWDIQNDRYNYELNNKSKESIDYLELLMCSNISLGYNGLCHCLNWNIFLKVILSCLFNNIAPYSPIFYNVKNNIFFYFDASGSIGLYFKHKTPFILNILRYSNGKYRIES